MTLETKPGTKAVYHPEETARMMELEGAELASFPSRFFAFLIDILLGAAIFLPVDAAFRYLVFHEENIHVDLDFHNLDSLAFLLLFFGLSNYLGNGKTIGKRIMGIRAVSLYHHRLGLWHSIERALGYGASALEAGFGFLQYFANPARRTVHDRIAETIVIRDRKSKKAMDL